MTEKASRGVRPWNLLPSCSLFSVFRNPLSLVKPGPNETYRHKTKEQIVGDTPKASVLEEYQLFCAWVLQLFSFAFQKLPAGTLSSRQTAQQQQQQQGTTKKVTSCCILKWSWSFFLSLPFFLFLLSVCLSLSLNNRSELSPSTRTYNWKTKETKPSPKEAKKSPKSNDQDIKSCLITAISVFSSSWHFNNRKIFGKEAAKGDRTWRQTTTHASRNFLPRPTSPFLSSSSSSSSSPPSSFFLLATSSQYVRWVHIKFPKLSFLFPSFHYHQLVTIPGSSVGGQQSSQSVLWTSQHQVLQALNFCSHVPTTPKRWSHAHCWADCANFIKANEWLAARMNFHKLSFLLANLKILQ